MLLSPAALRAQNATPETAGPSDPLSSAIDVRDLWRLARGKEPNQTPDAAAPRRYLFVAPTIGSRPSTGLTGGARVSAKEQVLGTARFAVFSKRDTWLFQGDQRLWWTSQDTFGLGGNTPATAAGNVKYDQLRFYQTAYRSVSPGLFLGVGLNISDNADVEPGLGASGTWQDSPYVTYSLEHGFALDHQTSSGPSVSLTLDTRDNQINARSGTFASASYRTFFEGFLGGDSTWHELYVDARTYRGLTKDARHRLAFWFLADLITMGTTPYFDLPSTGNPERSGRGYAEGRYRGEHMLYGEVEYRGDITRSGLLGVVAFFNMATIDHADAGEKLFDSVAPGGGLGVRVLLNKRSRSNFCVDYGWGKDGSRGFYLYLQEAF